jgi:hypothetical protein
MLEELSTTSNEEDKDILNDVYIRWPVEYEVLAEGLMGTIR